MHATYTVLEAIHWIYNPTTRKAEIKKNELIEQSNQNQEDPMAT